MKQWFAGLSQREQWVLGLGAFVVAASIVYGLLWAPLSQGVVAQASANRSTADDLAWMKTAAAVVRSRKAAPGDGGSKTLTGLIDSTLPAYKLTMQRFQPVGDSAAQLWLEDAPIDQVMAWLSDAEISHGLRLVNVALTPSDKPGYVQARVRLEQG